MRKPYASTTTASKTCVTLLSHPRFDIPTLHCCEAGVLLAGALAYSATLSNEFGSSVKTMGGAANKAYNKVVEVNEQYDLLPKTKTALDTVTTAAGNLNENYGDHCPPKSAHAESASLLCPRHPLPTAPVYHARVTHRRPRRVYSCMYPLQWGNK